MERRDALRILAGALAVPALQGLTPDEAWALGRDLHRRIALAPRPGRVLTDAQMRTVALMAERIIPATDTPGATDARVAEFIDLMLAEWFENDERSRFLDGLLLVDARSRARHGTPFSGLTEPQQAALVDELDAEIAALRDAGANAGNHFFQQFKGLTVHGYYTSEPGVRQELRWLPIPGGYDPCRAFVPRTNGGF